MLLVGLATMIVSEAATIAGIEPFASWNTPICWTGFILFADAIVFRARGESWIRSAPREFAALTLVSIPLWVVFEGFNLVIRNWNYTGLPENPALRLFGYAWSFATIWPAIFEGAELAAVWRARGSTSSPRARNARPEPVDQPPRFALRRSAETLARAEGRAAWSQVALGIVMLAVPFVVPSTIAPYMAAPVFLGFVFLLDPINRRLGAEALTRDRVVNLVLSGFLCGVLWEFWNYWARAKWHYTVPIMEHLKIFEMPVPGYFGFPAFALECFTMYVSVRALFCAVRAGSAVCGGRTIAL